MSSIDIVNSYQLASSSSRMTFFPWCDFSALIHTYSFFISFSTYESHPLAVMESVMAGVPVFLSNIASHRQFDFPEQSYFDHLDFDKLLVIFKYSPADLADLAVIQRDKLKQAYFPEHLWSHNVNKTICSFFD